MEESIGETLSEKLEDFDEVIPNIAESTLELNDKPSDEQEVVEVDEGKEEEIVEEQEVKEEVKDLLENGVDHSPVSNGHSIVTEATIEAHDMTDLEQSTTTVSNDVPCCVEYKRKEWYIEIKFNLIN